MYIKNILFICFLLFCNCTLGFTLNRVIVASDTNPMYLDFWPIVAKAWKQIVGIQPTLALIAHKQEIVVDTTVGDILWFEPIPGVPTWQHAQMIRMLLPAFFENDFCIVSDIDMLPMSKTYFIQAVKNIPDDRFVSMHDGMYGKQSNGIPQGIPMCYIAAKGKIFKEVFGIKSIQAIDLIIRKWSQGHEKNWGHDEQILQQYVLEWHRKTRRGVFLGYDCNYVKSHRLDRINWPECLDTKRIQEGWYHDSHMLRPLDMYRKEIDKLILALGLVLT